MKTLEEFLEDLGYRESSGDYAAKNQFGYLGKYQMGEEALVDTGYYKRRPGSRHNAWDGEFTGKDGIYTMANFLDSPSIQEKAQREFKKKQWGYLKNLGADKYIGSKINGIEITPSGLLAAAHLLGQGGVMKYLENNGNATLTDGYNTNIEEYLKKFSGYDISDIIYPSPITLKARIEKTYDSNNNELTLNELQELVKKGARLKY